VEILRLNSCNSSRELLPTAGWRQRQSYKQLSVDATKVLELFSPRFCSRLRDKLLVQLIYLCRLWRNRPRTKW